MHFCSFVSLCYADFCTFFGVLFLLFYCFDRYALNIFVLAPRFECCPRAHFNWIFYFAQWKQKLNMRAQRSAKSVIIPLPSPISHFPSHINFDSSLPLNLWFSLSPSLSCPCPVPGDVAACTNAQRSWGKSSKKRIVKCLCQESIILAIFVESLHGHTYES